MLMQLNKGIKRDDGEGADADDVVDGDGIEYLIPQQVMLAPQMTVMMVIQMVQPKALVPTSAVTNSMIH